MADAKKTPAKKTAAKKTTAKPAAKKPAAKKAVAKKTATAKPAAKTPAKKVAAKPAVKKAAPAKKVTPKKAEPVSAAPKTVIFRVLRGAQINGKLQQKTQEYKVNVVDSTTVLQGLEQIKGEQDGTLTFRRSCCASICGSCGMYIDNRSRLACKTKVKDLLEGNEEKNIAKVKSGVIEIAPQQNQPVLKDLVVDIKPFFNKVEKIIPYVQEGKETEPAKDKQAYEQVNLVSNCIMCGVCYSDCTAMVENENYIGPAALAKAYRFVADPREGKKSKRLKELSKKDGVWDCTRCGMCVDACPKGVAPMEAIVKLRSKAIAKNITNNNGARHALVFKEDIRTWGVLNEAFMLVKTMRLGILGQIGNALNLAAKGKIPNPFPYDHKVERLDEITAIYQELEANPISVETRAEDSGPGAG